MVDKVGLIYTDEYLKYNFGNDHPLRPLRLKLTYSLMEKLGLLQNERLEIIKPRIACTAIRHKNWIVPIALSLRNYQ